MPQRSVSDPRDLRQETLHPQCPEIQLFPHAHPHLCDFHLKTVGKSLAYVGAPLPTALIDSYFVGKQISEDRSAAEIAKDPLNWLGLATMSTLSEISGVSKPGKMNAALRLGMSPGLIRGVSRFAGIPGLAISTALTAYDQYNKYKNEEGLIYNLFNDKAKAV